MKNIKIIMLVAISAISFAAKAQTDKATTARIVETKRFTFVATSAMPLNATDINKVLSRIPGSQGGGNINLSGSGYDLRITPDTLKAYLPYYGRAYQPPLNRDDNGVQFTSTKFDYEIKKGKKQGWNVRMKTTDVKDNNQMNLAISESGYATLSLISNNRQSITYYGYLAENK